MSFDKQLGSSIDTYCKYLATKLDKRPPYLFQSSHIYLREDLVSWLIDTSNELEFNVRVKHLGVYLLDIYLDHHTVQRLHWKMVALCCLLLAAKVDESQHSMHKKLNEILGNRYKLRVLVDQEMNILQFFKFNVLYVTVVDFMELYSIFAVHPTDRRSGEIKDFEAITLYVNKHIAYFMDKVLLDASYYRFRPAHIVAAIILTTRHFAQLTPPWPVVLQQITGYGEQDLNMCSKLLRRGLDEDTIKSIAKYAIDPINSACCNAVCSPLNSPLKEPILSFTKYPLDPMNYSRPRRNAASRPPSDSTEDSKTDDSPSHAETDDSKTDDSPSSTKTNDSPSSDKTDDSPSSDKTDDSPSSDKTDDSPSSDKTDDSKTDNSPSRAKTDSSPSSAKKNNF